MRVICLDVGERRIGVAVTDALDLTAQGVETIWCKGVENDLARVQKICKQYETDRILCGLPRNMDGSEGPRAELCREFATVLGEATGLPIVMWDERRTTVEAHNILSQHNYHGKKRKDTVDAVAASLILEGYLAFKKR